MPTNLIANLRINVAPAYRDIDIFRSKIGNKGFTQPLGRISGDAAEFSKSLQAAAARVTAFGATTGAIFAVQKAISETAKATIEVNKQLVELNTFLGASQKTLDKFGKTLFDISRQTATPFGDVAEAAKEFARQGLSLEETSKRTKDALILARVAGIGYGQAVNGITTAINSFNKEALDSTAIINKLIAVDTRFAVSAKDINEAFVRVGSAAEEAGISSNKLVAAITAAQQVTGRGGAVIGNALKTIFTRLQRTEVIDQLKDIGVAVNDQSGRLLDGIEILKNYATATKNLSQTEKNRADELLGGVYQINQLQGLVKDLTSANSVYASALRTASSATDEASKKNEQLDKSLSALLTRTSATALQVGSDIGKNLFTPIIEAGATITETILKALSPENYSEKAGQTGKSIGDSVSQTLSKGVGQFLVYGGLPVAGALAASMAGRLVTFVSGALKSSIGSLNAPLTRVLEGKPFLESDYKRQLQLQEEINSALKRNRALSNAVASGTITQEQAHKIIINSIREENKLLQTQASLAETLSQKLYSRGFQRQVVSSISDIPVAGATRRRDPKTGRFVKDFASGYMPMFGNAAEEVANAKAYGAKNPKAKLIQATIKGKTQPVMVNSEEDIIPNFAGTGDTAIIPRYRKMQDIPRMGSGYVPNFSWSKTNKMPKEFLAKYPESKAVIKAGRMYSPEVRGMLQKLQSGENIDRDLLEALIERDIPIREVVAPSSIKNLPSKSLIRNALDKEQAKRVGKLSELPAGSNISVRQDVPSMTRKGVGVVKTLGPEGFKSYDSFVAFDNPVMNKSSALEKASLAIGAGANKSPLLKISGTLSENQSLPKDLSSWTQVGFNPDRHSYYYDRKTKKPVVGGSKAIQIGNTVFVKDAQYGKKEDFLYAGGYVPNFAFSSTKSFVSGDRRFVDPETYSYLRYKLSNDKKAIDLTFSKSEAKGQGWQMFERLGKTAKRMGLPVRSASLSSQANDVYDITDASLARSGKYGIEQVLKVAFPQLIHRQKGSAKNTALSVNIDDGLTYDNSKVSGKNIFSIVAGLASQKFKGDAKLLRNSIIDGSFGISDIVTNFAGGRIPNFAKRIDVIEKIGKEEIFARFRKHYEQGKDYAGFYNIHGEEFSGKKLSPQEAKIYANITSAISPSVPDYVAAQFAAPIFNRFMQTRSTNVEDYFDLAPSKKVSRHKNVFGLGLFGLKGTISKQGNIRKRDDVRRSGLSKALRGLDLGSDDTAKTRHYARAILQDKTAFPIDTNVIQAILGGKKPSKTEAAKLISLANEFATLNKIETGAAGLQAAIFKSNSKHSEKYSPETVRSALSGIEGRASGYVPNFAKILIAAKYYDALKVGKAKGVNISKTGDVQNIGREVFGGIGFSASRIGKGYASAVRSTSPTTALKNASQQAGVTKSIIVPVVASSAVNDPVPENLKTNEALLQQFLANHPKPKEIIASLSERGFNVKSILNSHSGAEIKNIIDILSSDLSNKKILAQSADQLKDPRLVKFFAPGGVKARGPKGTYAFGSSIASMQQGEYASKIPGKHKSYPILVTGKIGPSVSKPINAEEIFPGITNNKNRLFFSSVYQFGTRVLDTDNPEHLKLLDRLGYSQKILQQEKLIAGGYIPNFAGLSDAIGREKTMSGLPASQIMAHFDGKGKPIAVTNKRDEPNGLRDVVPNYAKMPKLNAQNLVLFNQILGLLTGAVETATTYYTAEGQISPSTAKYINIATSAISGLAGVVGGFKTLGKKSTTSQKVAAIGIPALISGSTALGGYFASKQGEKAFNQSRIQKESDRIAQQFSDLTNNTQELSDTLAKLDAAYKNVSTNPEELIKLTKKSAELTTKITKTNPQLAAKLAAEPDAAKRLDILQENTKEAANKQAVEQEILKFRSGERLSNKDITSSFEKIINSVGENIFKNPAGSVTEKNLPQFLKENKLESLSKFFDEQDKEIQEKLKPTFIAAVNSQIKLNNEAIKYNKDISKIQQDLYKFRSKIESARELRKFSFDTRNEGLQGFQEFSRNFGRRAEISTEADIYKFKESLKPINQFRQAINVQAKNEQLGFSRDVINKLEGIKTPGDTAKKQLEEIIKTNNLTSEQKEAIQNLITQNETSTKELEKINQKASITQRTQEKLLSIQEKLSFGGGIKTSIDARSRVEAMNAPLRGALEYQLGGALGSPRSQVAGQVNFLKSIQGLYPGLIDKTGGLDSVSKSLSALRMGDLQKDLLRNSMIANQMGLSDVAKELRNKAFDPKALAEIAKTQTEAELQTGKTPSDVIAELRDAFEEFNTSLNKTFEEEAARIAEEKRITPELSKRSQEFSDLASGIQTSLAEAFKNAFGPDGAQFKNAVIQATNPIININTVAETADKVKNSLGLSKGYIPSFYNPLREAVQRENQFVPLSSIRINKSNKLVNQDNPFGLAVTNILDEPNGLRDVGIFSKGYVPNFAAFGSKAASEAKRNAALGKLYVWDNIDNGFRKVKPNGSVDTTLIDAKSLPKGAKTISTELSQTGGRGKSIIPLKDPGVTKLDELKLPGIARSKPIDSILAKLESQGRLTPKNLLNEINKISGNKDIVVKTAFGESNVQSRGVYGLGGALTTADTRSMIGKYRRGTASGLFAQEKVPTYYNELRVHVAVDDKGNVKIIKGGTVLKATGFDPSAGPSIKAYMDAGLSRNEATKMANSFRKSAEGSAFESIRALVKSKGIKNAFFGVDVGGTTLQSAIDAGVKTREFYSGGRGRVGTIVFEVNPSDKGGSTGYMGRGLSEKLVRNVFGEKPPPAGLSSGSPAVGINPTGNPVLPQALRPSLTSGGPSTGLPSGFKAKPTLSSSALNFAKDAFLKAKGGFGQFGSNIYNQAKNFAGKLGSGVSGLFGGAKGLANQAGSNLLSLGKNILGLGGKAIAGLSTAGLAAQAGNSYLEGNKIDATIYGAAALASGLSATKMLGKFSGSGVGISTALMAGMQARDEILGGQYKNAAISATQAGLYTASIFSKAAPLTNVLGKGALGIAGNTFGYASALGLAKDIANAENFQLASDWSDVLFGKKEQGGGIGDLVGTAFTAFSGPVGAAAATAKIGYRVGNVIENKLGIGDKFGEIIAGPEAASRAKYAGAGLAKSITKRDVIEGKNTASEYIKSKRADLEELNRGIGLAAGGDKIIDILNKDLNEINAARKEKQRQEQEQARINSDIAQKAQATQSNERAIKQEEAKRKEDQDKFDSSLRRKIIEGVNKNSEISGLETSRDKALYIIDQEKRFGKFSESDFGGDKGLYDSYKNYSDSQRREAERERRLLDPKIEDFYKNGVKPTDPKLQERAQRQFEKAQETAEATRNFRDQSAAQRATTIPFSPEEVSAATNKGVSVEELRRQQNESTFVGPQGTVIGGAVYSDSEIKEAYSAGISVEELRARKSKTVNKSAGFIPNFAYGREKLNILTSPDYAGYRNAVPEPSKYYKNVVKNTAEIEVPASEVYNRMGFFGAQPKDPSQKYAILNPAQQAQLGYAANGFIPNFAPEQFAGVISEALQQALAPMVDKMGASVSNSNVINVSDQRSFDVTSDKVNGVMEFLQKQFPTQFARQMGPKKV